MDMLDKPMETITQWQEWYRKNRQVASIDTPLVSKDSREKMHDTSNATSVLSEWEASIGMKDSSIYFEKAIDAFEDTLCEFSNDLTATEMFDAFKAAVQNTYNTHKKEFDNAQQLFDIVHRKDCKKTCETKKGS